MELQDNALAELAWINLDAPFRAPVFAFDNVMLPDRHTTEQEHEPHKGLRSVRQALPTGVLASEIPPSSARRLRCLERRVGRSTAVSFESHVYSNLLNAQVVRGARNASTNRRRIHSPRNQPTVEKPACEYQGRST